MTKDIRPGKKPRQPSKKKVEFDEALATLEGFDMPALLPAGRDAREAAKKLGGAEVRWLVKYYYRCQRLRMQSASQQEQFDKAGTPNALVTWIRSQMETIENAFGRNMGIYAQTYTVGQWLASIRGIGAIFCAGFLTAFDIRKAPYPSSMIRFAGLDPTIVWLPEQKRPYSEFVKTMCWKAATSFVKQAGRPGDFYGELITHRKSVQWSKNLSGQLSEYALRGADDFPPNSLSYRFRKGFYRPETIKKIIEHPDKDRRRVPLDLPAESGGIPMLPPAAIQLRAQRHVMQIFLSHLHEVMHRDYYGTEPPKPWVFQYHLPGQQSHDLSQYIPPPNWAGHNFKGRPLRDMLEDFDRYKKKAPARDEDADEVPDIIPISSHPEPDEQHEDKSDPNSDVLFDESDPA